MTTVGESTTANGKGHNIFTRLPLVVTSPGAAYAEIAARPAALGALAVVIGVIVVCQVLFLTTPVGQQVMIDQQVQGMEAFGVTVTDQMYDELRSKAGNMWVTTAVSQIVSIPIVAALVAGLLLGIFNAVSDSSSTFKHVYAVVAHAGIVLALQQVVLTPISYLMGEFANVTRLSVFFPMLEPDSLLSHLLSGIEMFTIWWLLNLSIGVAVLYRRPTRSVAGTLLGIYAGIVVVIALLRAAF
jgi:hypothetical protein